MIADHFWRGWEAYRRPTFVSFNGRGFDLPLLELAAFRFRAKPRAPGLRPGRKRTSSRATVTMPGPTSISASFLTNFGATRFTGGLNLAANLSRQTREDGCPGRHGSRHVRRWTSWARSTTTADVMYSILTFVFLRSRVVHGATHPRGRARDHRGNEGVAGRTSIGPTGLLRSTWRSGVTGKNPVAARQTPNCQNETVCRVTSAGPETWKERHQTLCRCLSSFKTRVLRSVLLNQVGSWRS